MVILTVPFVGSNLNPVVLNILEPPTKWKGLGSLSFSKCGPTESLGMVVKMQNPELHPRYTDPESLGLESRI